MLHMSSPLSRWSGTLSAAALLTLVALPARASDTSEFVAATDQETLSGSATSADGHGLVDRNGAAGRRQTDDTWAANHPNRYNDATVRLNGVVVMRLHAGAEGLSAVERARAVQQRLNDACEGLDYASLNSDTQTSVAASSIVTVATEDGAPVIYFNGHMLLTVTSADATANGSDEAADLAAVWAGYLRKGALAQHVRGARRRYSQAITTTRTFAGGGHYIYERLDYNGAVWRDRADN